MTNNHPYRVLLQCGHEALFYPSPRIGEVVYCTRCQGYHVVTHFVQHKHETDKWSILEVRFAYWTVTCKDCGRKSHVTTETIALQTAETHQTIFHQTPTLTERPIT